MGVFSFIFQGFLLSLSLIAGLFFQKSIAFGRNIRPPFLFLIRFSLIRARMFSLFASRLFDISPASPDSLP